MSMIATEFGDSSPFSDLSLYTFGVTSASFSAPISASMFYGFSNLTSFGMSDPLEPALSAEDACSEGGTSGTGYHDGTGTYPAAGDNVYSDSAGTTALADGYYRINSGQSINVESGALSEAPANCGR